jgi:hypothetical protein
MPRSPRLYAGYRLASKAGFLPDFSRNHSPIPVLISVFELTTRLQRFIFIGLRDTYLTSSALPFAVTLTTMAFDHSSLRWFEAHSCKSAPKGPPSSLTQLAWHTRICSWTSVQKKQVLLKRKVTGQCWNKWPGKGHRRCFSWH